jgi:hypothetical protein
VCVIVPFMKLFLLLALLNFRPKQKKRERDIMDVQLFVHKENVDKLISRTLFKVCCSAHTCIIYIETCTYIIHPNSIKLKRITMHQNNLISIIVDQTLSRATQCISNMVIWCVRIELMISEIQQTFFLNWFKIEK